KHKLQLDHRQHRHFERQHGRRWKHRRRRWRRNRWWPRWRHGHRRRKGWRMTTRRAISRPGYTLLEMTLALAIALVILVAVYEFLNRQMTLAETGRDLVEESSLVRVILDRMSVDIGAHLGGIDPQQLPGASSDATTASVGAEAYTPLFNGGVEGTDTALILST